MFKTLFFLLTITLLLTLSAARYHPADNRPESPAGTEKTFQETGSVERFSPLMDDIIPPGELPEIIAEGFNWAEGPLWLPDQDVLIFSDVPENTIFQWSEKDGLKLYLKPSGYTDTIPRGGEMGSNGLVLDLEGRLVLCQCGNRCMGRMDAPLDKPQPNFTTLTDKWQGKRFNSPNDAAYNSRGDLFFTDPAYGMEFRYRDPNREMDFTGVYRLSAEGELTLLTDQFSAPNGIGLSPDDSKLYIANSGGGGQAVWMEYGFKEDGSLDEGRIFLDTSGRKQGDRGAPDGFEIRKDGIFFASGPGGIWIISPEGEHLGTVRTGYPTSNCTVDNEGGYLYMTADMYIMRIKLK